MSKQSDAVKRWRKNTKQKLVAAFGGKCAICGYHRCIEALELHHTDPSTKEMHWGNICGSPVSWQRIVLEMSKCVMLCSICHKEVHAGYSVVPHDAQQLDESLIPADLLYVAAVHDECPVCGMIKSRSKRTCSIKCANTRRIRIVDWDKHDVVALYAQYKNYEEIGELLGVTGAAVRRKYLRMINKQ